MCTVVLIHYGDVELTSVTLLHLLHRLPPYSYTEPSATDCQTPYLN